MMDDFLTVFTNFKNILCVCPNCQALPRLSELQIFSTKKAPKDWMDDWQQRMNNLQEKVNEFSEKESKIRDEAAKRAQVEVPKLIKKSLSDHIVSLKYNPYDIKPINHPIDLVIYDGMSDGDVENVVFLHSKNKAMQELHKSVHKTVENKDYDWKVVRVSTDGELEFED